MVLSHTRRTRVKAPIHTDTKTTHFLVSLHTIVGGIVERPKVFNSNDSTRYCTQQYTEPHDQKRDKLKTLVPDHMPIIALTRDIRTALGVGGRENS